MEKKSAAGRLAIMEQLLKSGLIEIGIQSVNEMLFGTKIAAEMKLWAEDYEKIKKTKLYRVIE